MRSRQLASIYSVAGFVAFIPATVLAGGSDYAFVAATTSLAIAQAKSAPIEIKLLDKSGQPVSGATITRVRLDMAPDGMAQHTAAAVLQPTERPGVYQLQAEYSMIGHWQLSLAAKVPGETETVVSKVILTVAR